MPWRAISLVCGAAATVARAAPAAPAALAVLLAAGALPSCAAHETAVIRTAGDEPKHGSLEEPPAERDPTHAGDFVEQSIIKPFGKLLNPPSLLRSALDEHPEAYNVDSDDDVVDPDWFRHRNARDRMTLEQIARGPTHGTGPDTSATWLVVRAKVQGITPGFTIRDGRGDEYLVKFDPPGYPELTTAAEVIAGRLFYAAGYHVAETFITAIDPSRIEASESLSVEDPLGRRHPITDADLAAVLERVARRPDGRVRAVASRIIPDVLGPFSFEGTRSDDPLDTIPHQYRRELRGLYVMAAWLNHVDIREQNTLDALVESADRRFVRHYLLDFGSTLGSASVRPNLPRDGVEYDLDLTAILARLVTAGFHAAPWERYEYEIRYPSIGYYSTDLFDPGSWTTDYPNPAFLKRTIRDGYWGAKLVASFDEAQIRAAVSAGQLSDPQAAEALTRTILARREMTLRHWFLRTTPLEELAAAGGPGAPALVFRDLAVVHGVMPADERSYRLKFEFDAAGLRHEETIRPEVAASGEGRLRLPKLDRLPASTWEELSRRPPEARLARLEVRALPRPGDPETRSVRIYLLPNPVSGYRIVGKAY